MLSEKCNEFEHNNCRGQGTGWRVLLNNLTRTVILISFDEKRKGEKRQLI